MNKHEWRERTDEGELRKVRATHHGGHWRLQVQLASDDGWNDLDPPPRSDLEALREVLWGKYKRNRLPHRQIDEIDALLEATSQAADDDDPAADDKVRASRGRRGRRG